jgi:hypothetical protein
MHMAWVARLQRESGAAPAKWQLSYKLAITALTTDYSLWIEYIKALEADPKATLPDEWLRLGRIAAGVFKVHHEAGWALVDRCFKNGETVVKTPADREALLLEIHQVLSQKTQPKMYGYPLPNVLNWQADWIGDPATAVDYFGKLLAMHYSEKPELNWVFGTVMAWGNGRFAANSATASAYANAIGNFFASQGAKADKNQISGTIVAGIRKASEAGDANAYSTWLSLSKRLLPAVAPGDVFLNDQQLAARPNFKPFPGALLSQTGVLSSSSASYDKPLTYDQVTGGGVLGYFDTGNEQKPWAKITLTGEGELTGIVLVDRYEYLAEQPWDVPLKVEVSTDGTKWTQVALFEKAEPVYRIDLEGKKLRAKYVRIERQPGPDAAHPNNGRLHMRNFLVYGRKLY